MSQPDSQTLVPCDKDEVVAVQPEPQRRKQPKRGASHLLTAPETSVKKEEKQTTEGGELSQEAKAPAVDPAKVKFLRSCINMIRLEHLSSSIESVLNEVSAYIKTIANEIETYGEKMINGNCTKKEIDTLRKNFQSIATLCGKLDVSRQVYRGLGSLTTEESVEHEERMVQIYMDALKLKKYFIEFKNDDRFKFKGG